MPIGRRNGAGQRGADDGVEVPEAARGLIDTVVVSPPGDPGDPPKIDLTGNVIAMLKAGGANLTSDDATVGASATGLLSYQRSNSSTVGIRLFMPSDAGRKPPACVAFAGLPADRTRSLGTSQSPVPLVSSPEK